MALLVTFPNEFFQRATSQVTISQVATSQRLGQALCGAAGCIWGRALRLGWTRRSSAAARTDWGRALRLGQTWKVAAWKVAHLGSCHLEKYPWEVATWEKSFGKVPNISVKDETVKTT